MPEPETNPVPPSSPAVRLLHQLRSSGEHITLNINGKMILDVLDDRSFDLLLELADRLDLGKILRERLEYFEREGEGISLEEAKERARQKYGYTA